MMGLGEAGAGLATGALSGADGAGVEEAAVSVWAAVSVEVSVARGRARKPTPASSSSADFTLGPVSAAASGSTAAATAAALAEEISFEIRSISTVGAFSAPNRALARA